MLSYGGDILERFQRLDLMNILRENDTLKPPAFNEALSTLLVAASEATKLYDIEIGKLTQKLEIMREEKDQVQRQLDIGKSCVAPVRRLPTEILVEIFELACWEGFGRGPGSQTPDNACIAALAVSSVCVSWRTIALGLPVIWGDLIATCVNTPNKFTYIPLPFKIQFVSMLHERARGARLSLTLLRKDANFHVFEPVLSQVVHCDIIRTRSHDEMQEFLQAMPNLIECRIETSWTFAPRVNERDLSSLVPHLRRVGVSRKLRLPWGQLHSLILDRMSIVTVMSILPHCSRLEHLTLLELMDDDPDDEDRILHQPPTTLPKLLSLTMPMSSPHRSEALLLDVLHLPTLNTLSVIDYSSVRTTDVDNSIFSLLKRSGCLLQRLVTKRFIFHPSSVVRLLEETPSLMQLEYVFDTFEGEEIFSIVAPHNATNAEVTSGKELALKFKERVYTGLEVNLLLTMLMSHWNHPRKLAQGDLLSAVGSVRSLKVDIPCLTLAECHWDSLRSLHEFGVKIRVTDACGDVGSRFESQTPERSAELARS